MQTDNIRTVQREKRACHAKCTLFTQGRKQRRLTEQHWLKAGLKKGPEDSTDLSKKKKKHKKKTETSKKIKKRNQKKRERKEKEASKGAPPETAQKHVFFFFKKKKMLQEFVQQWKTENPKQTKPWTLKVALRPSGVLLAEMIEKLQGMGSRPKKQSSEG